MIKIAITGPESSGKTTMARSLAEYFQCPWIPEYARDYLTMSNGVYSISDLDTMAVGQVALWQQVNNQKLVFYDTEILVYLIWSKVKFGKVSDLIKQLLSQQNFDHYFLCMPDIPWEPDPLRENPDDRNRLYQLYEEEIKKLKLSYTILSGPLESRMNTAKGIIEKFTY